MSREELVPQDRAMDDLAEGYYYKQKMSFLIVVLFSIKQIFTSSISNTITKE
jgi:hypothetical protein